MDERISRALFDLREAARNPENQYVVATAISVAYSILRDLQDEAHARAKKEATK